MENFEILFNLAVAAAYLIGTYLDQATSKGREANPFMRDERTGELDRKKFWLFGLIAGAVAAIPMFLFPGVWGSLMLIMFAIYRFVIAFKNNDINRKRKV